jgi:uncharacterized protein YciI
LSDTERAFLVEATLSPDAITRRVPVRPAHLARLRALLGDGRLIVGGAVEDLSESILIIRAADLGAARAIVEADVYVAEGVWTEIRIRPIQLVEAGAPSEP